MTDRKPTFTEACHDLGNAVRQVIAVYLRTVPALPILARLTGRVLWAAIPAPLRRLIDARSERWLDALFILLFGGFVALLAVVVMAHALRWI